MFKPRSEYSPLEVRFLKLRHCLSHCLRHCSSELTVDTHRRRRRDLKVALWGNYQTIGTACPSRGWRSSLDPFFCSHTFAIAQPNNEKGDKGKHNNQSHKHIQSLTETHPIQLITKPTPPVRGSSKARACSRFLLSIQARVPRASERQTQRK